MPIYVPPITGKNTDVVEDLIPPKNAVAADGKVRVADMADHLSHGTGASATVGDRIRCLQNKKAGHQPGLRCYSIEI